METTIKTPNTPNTEALKQAWAELKAASPQLRIRDAAAQLGVSELELLTTQLGEGVTRLTAAFDEQLKQFPTFGRVMALTRNEGCVLEHKGPFQKITLHGAMPQVVATVIGPIEQRVFLSGWKYGFAVVQDSPRGVMRSLQYFDGEGQAVLKVFMQSKSNLDAFDDFVATYAAEDQGEDFALAPYPTPVYAEEIDVPAFRTAWENMKDTHDFFGMLKTFNVHRLEALKLIGKPWAYPVDRLEAVRTILQEAAAQQLPIMIFAGNRGNIQIHQGKVKNIKQFGTWLNVMDPDFNMHLNEEQVASAWVVHKQTTDGLVSSVELFDATGEMIAQFFGLRKPGLAQNETWKKIIDSLV
ncbi:MAG: hemin-degrading factor [Nitritalea sp.]